MIQIDGGRLLSAYHWVATTTQYLSLVGPEMNPGFDSRGFSELKAGVSDLLEIAEKADLPVTAVVARSLASELDLCTPQQGRYLIGEGFYRLQAVFGRLCDAVRDEAVSRVFLVLVPQDAALWSAAEPTFGRSVHDAFPSAVEDINEAAKCLAVNRATACVMHLMRATEVPLKALAKGLGVNQQNDWGSYIREIDRELNARMLAAGKRTADENFYAEASVSFDRARRAWRNGTMHVDRTYTVEHAKSIFDATRDFLVHLADRIKE